MKLLTLTLTIMIFTLNMFAQSTSDVPSITIDEFINVFSSDPSVVILDVRTPSELLGPLGKIENSINIPIQELSGRINELNPYKDKQIYVICRTQNRSFASSQFLNKNGFNTVYVVGGMTDYYNRKNERK